MRPEEVRAVLAHEIGHVANGDMVTLALIQGVVNTFVMFFARIVAHLVDSFLKSRSDGEGGLGFMGYFAVVMVAEIVFGIVLPRLWLGSLATASTGLMKRVPAWQAPVRWSTPWHV